MYTAFNLKITSKFFNDISDLMAEGMQRKEQLQRDSQRELERFTLPDGLVDGTGLSDDWFQTVQSDVFISHSHNDQKLAFALAGCYRKNLD